MNEQVGTSITAINSPVTENPRMSLRTATVQELASLFGRITDEAEEAKPEIGTYDLLKTIAASVSKTAPKEAQERALQAALEGDAEEKEDGQKVLLLLLNAKTLVGVVDRFCKRGAARKEERDELIMTAIVAVLEKLSSLKSNQSFATQVGNIASRSIEIAIAERDNVPLTQVLKRVSPGGYLPHRADAKSVLAALSEQEEEGREPFETAARRILKEGVEDVLSTLTPRERRVLQLRFGLDDGRNRTQEEVGREFGVRRERIHEIETKALRKLRHPSRSRKLKPYF